ncbi:MAG: hypothetical protein M3Z24_01310 [Chloroflexota bacterium]|nr:hypothetical protein [Chloroflexota bacterium]
MAIASRGHEAAGMPPLRTIHKIHQVRRGHGCARLRGVRNAAVTHTHILILYDPLAFPVAINTSLTASPSSTTSPASSILFHVQSHLFQL